MEIKLLDKDTNINKLHLNFCKEIIMNNETYKLLESIFSNEIIYTNSEELGIVAYVRGAKITIDNIGNYWVKLKLKDDISNNNSIFQFDSSLDYLEHLKNFII